MIKKMKGSQLHITADKKEKIKEVLRMFRAELEKQYGK